MDALLQYRGQVAGALLGRDQHSQLLAQDRIHPSVLDEDGGKAGTRDRRPTES